LAQKKTIQPTFSIGTLKIIINKMGNWFEKFSFLAKMLGKICCHGNHDMCKPFYEHSGHKMLYTYYHGCYGNIFFSKCFCEIWTFFKSNPFFLLLFLKARIFKNIRNTTLHCYNWNITTQFQLMEIIMLSTNMGNNKITEHKGSGLKGKA
jgi:hypothetical protein